MYIIRVFENGDIIEETSTYEEAQATVKAYEEEDRKDGCYEEDFYEIVETKFFVLESSTKRGYSWEGGQDPFDTLQEALDEANSRWSHLTRDEIAKLDEFIVVSGTVDDDDECIGNIIEVHYSFFVKGM